MSRNFEPILPLVPVDGLRLSVHRSGLYPGAAVAAQPLADGRVGISAQVTRRLLGLVPHQRRVVLGHIEGAAAQIVTAALTHDLPLRIRVVQLTPAHLSPTPMGDMAISIWADPMQLAPYLHLPTLHTAANATAP